LIKRCEKEQRRTRKATRTRDDRMARPPCQKIITAWPCHVAWSCHLSTGWPCHLARPCCPSLHSLANFFCL